MFQLQYFAGQRLSECEDGASSEIGEVNFLCHVLSHFVVGSNFLRFAECDLLVGVSHLVVVDNGSVAVDFAVALFGIYDYVEVFVRAKELGNHASEAFFEHPHHGGDINVLVFLKLRKGFDETRGLRFLFGHIEYWGDNFFT